MFNSDSNILTRSGLTADQINSLLAGRGQLAGLGASFLAIEETYGISAFWSVAQSIQEVGWSGNSAIAENFNNLFGITAYDANPYGDASHYDSPADCVQYYGNFLKTQYLTPGGAYYVSPTPAGVARHWASDPNYAAEIVNIMNILVARTGAPAPTEIAPVVQKPAGNIYVVRAAQNMSVIAQLVGLSLSQLESMNPQAGHPAGNFGNIWPGDQLNVGGAAPVAVNAPAEAVVVQPGQNLSVIAEAHGLTLAEIEAKNPTAGHPSGNFDVVWPGDTIQV